MKIQFGKPLIDQREIKAVSKVLKSGLLVHGPVSKKFEIEFCKYTKANHAISVSSCTAGMHLVYFTMGFKKDDEIIVCSQTHVATAHAIELTGAKPIFIDSNNYNGNINIEKIEKRISKKTKAIAVVHYLGVPVEMDKIMKLAKRKNLFVLEDCALSVGTKYNGVHVGLHGDVGVFSFYPVKHLTSGEGGMIITNDNKLAKKLELTKAFGVNRTHTKRKEPGMYNVEELGFNYRMSELHAAIGLEQVYKITKFLKKRRSNYLFLYQLLKNTEGISLLPLEDKKSIYSFYCFIIILDDKLKNKRSYIINKLNKSGIGTSIYYPHPVPRLRWYKKKYGYKKSNFINAEKFSDNTISFPVGPHLEKKHMKFVAVKLKNVLLKLL